jgi:transcriptional regulator with XRE-family HTH domain
VVECQLEMISDRIRALRKSKGWTQQQLAEKTRLSFNAVTKIEQGLAKSPTLRTLTKLADVFGIGLDELVGRK